MTVREPRDSQFRLAFRWLRFAYWRMTRGMTLGVRAMVLDDENRIFLVRHTYTRGWHFPGGGVDAGESLRGAVERELLEEADIMLAAEPRLHGVFRQSKVSMRDHVAVYVVRGFRQLSQGKTDHEIAESGFFAVDALPETTTPGTRARLMEVLEERPAAVDW